MKIIKRSLAIILLTIIIITIAPIKAQAATTYGVIVDLTPTNVRAGAGTNYKSIAKLKVGTKVTITGTSGSWYKIKYNKKTGYVHKTCLCKGISSLKIGKNYVLVVRSHFSAYYINSSGKVVLKTKCGVGTKTSVATVTDTTGVNLRQKPTTSSKKLLTIPYNTKVVITEQTNSNWYKVTYNQKTGYISKSCIKVATESRTPLGVYTISKKGRNLQSKSKDPNGIYSYYLKVGGAGCYLHGTAGGKLKVGGYYSNGCIRIPDKSNGGKDSGIKEWYNKVPKGAKVVITNSLSDLPRYLNYAKNN